MPAILGVSAYSDSRGLACRPLTHTEDRAALYPQGRARARKREKKDEIGTAYFTFAPNVTHSPHPLIAGQRSPGDGRAAR